jgi:serine/threonine protein kinase
MPTETDHLVAERYRLIEPLGRGGMGVVWRGEDTILTRPVAIKVVEFPDHLPPEERDAIEARVMREARAAARLNHPNVVTVFDVVEDEGRTYVVMELVEAPTLADIVKQNGPLPEERVVQIAGEVLAAIEAAHGEGIVHRDVKPGNVMIPPGQRVKLGDFGIASVKGDPKITSTGLILGSPSYMAPEQATSATSGPAADLWALGATLYFALEGRPPFDKGQALPTLAAVVGEEPPAMKNGGELAGVVTRLMAKEPADRPSAVQVRALLAAPETHPVTAPSPTRTTRWPLAIGAALLVALAAVGAVVALRDGGGSGGDRKEDGKANQAQAADVVAVPAGWTAYTSEATGHSIAYPPTWEVRESSIDDSSTDLIDPDSSTYLRLDWTDTPGDSPEGAWYSFEETFAAAHEGYERIAITPTTFKGMDAAEWEFTYEDGGVTLHAIDLGFITPNRGYGYALNFQTLDEEWGSEQPTFERLKASFEPPEGA